MPGARRLHVGGGDSDHRRLAAAHASAGAAGQQARAMVNRLLARKDEAVSAVLLGNSVMNILSASLTTAVLTVVFGAAGVVYATVIVGILVVVFAEVMPKTWALLRADRMALALAPSILFSLALLGPAARAVAWISRVFLSAMGVKVDRTHDAEEHDELLRGAIEMHGTGASGRGRAGREGDVALGPRSRRSHGRRRHDPSRQRRADRRRRTQRFDRGADAGGALHPHPALSRPARQRDRRRCTPRTCSARCAPPAGRRTSRSTRS